MYWYASDLGHPKFSPVSDSSCSILENDECWNNWVAFFGAKSRCFLPRSRSPAKGIRYADEALSFYDSAIRTTLRSYILIKYQHWLHTHSRFKSFDIAYLELKVELRLSWALLNYRSFLTFCFLTNLCKMVHFQKWGGLVPLISPLGASVLTTPEFYWQNRFWLSID